MSKAFKYILLIALLITNIPAKAQTSWPTPEIEQMYTQAREYLLQGNLPQAITTYKQAIRLAPHQMLLYRDLGKAYYLAGNYEDAQGVLDPLLKSNEADDQSYQVMAACQYAAGEKKKAKNTIQNGLEKYPNSGILYHQLGKIYEEGDEMVHALQTWLDGIHKDPTYHLNYYEAARTYANSDKPVWVIIYGEIFVNIERHTPRSDETRSMILQAYSKVFNSISSSELPKYGKIKKAAQPSNFEETVRNTLLSLSPVISDGLTTENLAMLRTRFLMLWFAQYADKYPFSLFRYEDKMARSGYFEIYNEWLLGKGDNAQEFEEWDKFHIDAIKTFENWAQSNPIKPETSDFYNDMNVDNIFARKKDR
jgi:tetratricopeptide (TPR) repeat protein